MIEADLRKLLNSLGVPKINYTKNNLVFPCVMAPWTHDHGTDQSPSMEIKINEQGDSLAHCFACKFSATLTGLMLALNAHSGGKYLKLLEWVMQIEADLGVGSEANRVMEDFSGRQKIPSTPVRPSQLAADNYVGRVPQYILNRGISLPTCKTWSLGYDDIENRAIFPVYDWFENLVGVVGRRINPKDEPKYKNYWNFEKSKYLYGEHLLSPDHPHVIVVEGMISALAAYEYGMRNVVGLLGSSLSEDQAKKIRQMQRNIYIMADMDEAGYKCRRQFLEVFQGKEVLAAVDLPSNDPADCTKQGLWDAFDNAKFY